MTPMTMEARRLVLRSAYPAAPSAVGIARRHAERRLEDWGVSSALIEDIGLVISELVTNSVEARVSEFRLVLAEDVPGSITVEVWDPSSEMPQDSTPRLDDVEGRGLVIVRALACHFGVQRDSQGKTVYAVIAPKDPARPIVPATPRFPLSAGRPV
ncbi:ATP-binding protein [Spirillospora sp. CA-294931]|uniref:ATP-binding protein n=1 Tax=Spirillospora sp. CA-294931 TaxID=3240042 RepID=UPI003D8F462A